MASRKLTLTVMASMIALASTVANAETLVTAVADPVGSLKDRMCLQFQNGVKARTKAVDFNYVQGEALGKASSVMEQHISGSVDVFCNEAVWFAEYSPDFQILGWGFTFRDAAHAKAFFQSDLFEPMKQKVAENGVRVLSVRPTQPRMMFSTFPVKSVEDVQDKKMRVPQLKAYLELWKAIGTRPTQVAWGEVYLALNTGVVVAAEGPPTDAMGQNFHQVAKNITRTDHLFSTVHISINQAKWQELDAETQKIIQEEADKATDWGMATGQAEVASKLAQAEKEGATISEIDKAPFQARSREAVKRLEAEGLWSKGLWESIQGL